MSEFAILKITQGELTNRHELQSALFRQAIETLLKMLARGVKPVVVIQAEPGAAMYCMGRAPAALIEQTRLIAQWVAVFSESNILSAQLVVERCRDGTDRQLLHALSTIRTLADLGVIPVLIHNQLTWLTGRAEEGQWDIAECLADRLRATIEAPKQEQEQVMERDHVIA
ncbi:hypothetical protein [Pseudomonas yamanorum]|uniref:hypothetical protein n=1 Tax=Pseudomonas yamanorum TaxID=515393 RepID=UPI003B9FC64E